MVEYFYKLGVQITMFNKRIILSLFVLLFSASIFVCDAAVAPVKTPAVQQVQTSVIANTKPLEIVSNPYKFLNKKVQMTAKFDKFTTLGLDYKKAMRDSQKYIGFLVQRDDVKDHNVPLSELKMFITREYAEKFIDLNTGDTIKITGKVFSTALGDGWIDVSEINVVEKAPVTK